MIKQYFILEDYDWEVWVYYYVDRVYSIEILTLLEDIGCSKQDYKEALLNLTSPSLNRGLCYSNNKKRKSVLVVSDTTSPEQFFNSIIHEIKHLERHISKTCGINPYGEEAAYLVGKLAQKLYPKAKYFLCNCCYTN